MSLEDRKQCLELANEAQLQGATRANSAEVLGLSPRTMERWQKNPEAGDGRKGPLTLSHRCLSEVEKKKILEVCNADIYKDLSPWKIVASLADTGSYLASESTIYRVLKEAKLLRHREKRKPMTRKRPKDLLALKPNMVWSWDITYLKSPVKGIYFYLYLVMDIYSRYIVGSVIEEVESSEHAAKLMASICNRENICQGQLTLHSDNGAPMKGATLLATLQRLDVIPSFSRPSVSDDNPYSESLFNTLKCRPSYPDQAFASIEEAKQWVETFITWYNTQHLHSGIKFVTPESRHLGKDVAILKKRTAVYEAAKLAAPQRWSGKTRDWTAVTEVTLNPGKGKKHIDKIISTQAA